MGFARLNFYFDILIKFPEVLKIYSLTELFFRNFTTGHAQIIPQK